MRGRSMLCRRRIQVDPLASSEQKLRMKRWSAAIRAACSDAISQAGYVNSVSAGVSGWMVLWRAREKGRG